MAGALSLYMFVDGTDRRLQRRYEDINNIQRIHLVMERVCTTLVMSDRAQLRAGASTGAVGDSTSTAIAALGGLSSSPGTPGGSKSGASGSKGTDSTSANIAIDALGARSGSKTDGKSGSSSTDKSGTDNRPGSNTPRVPPRIVLSSDSRFAAEAASLSTIVTGVAEGPSAQRLMTQPQRLEVALSASPVPSTITPAALEAARRAASTGTSRDATSSSTSESSRNFGPRSSTLDATSSDEGDDPTSSRVIRGALELRPQRTRSRTARPEAPEQVLWELWWVPLAPRTDPDPEAPPPSMIGDPFLVASDISYLQYRMFDDRVRKTSYQAAFMQDIPAYVEVEVETARGLKANWLFEVSWSIGNELPPDQTPSSGSDAAAGKGGSTATNSKSGSGAGTGTTKNNTTGGAGGSGGKAGGK